MKIKLFVLLSLLIILFVDKCYGNTSLRAKRVQIGNEKENVTETTINNINNLETTTEENEEKMIENNLTDEGKEDNLTTSSNNPTISTNNNNITLNNNNYYENLQEEEFNNNISNINNNYNITDFDGKNCVLAPEKGLAFKTKINGELEYLVEGKILIANEKNEINNFGMSILEESSQTKCGTGNYDQFSYCAKLKFLGSKVNETIKLMERNNPKNISEYKANYLQDFVLVLIEGCIICENNNQSIQIKLIQIDKQGPIKSVCKEENKNISKLYLDFGKYKNSFIIGGVLNERLCPSRQTINDEIKLAQLSYKHKIKIVIEHSCKGENATHVINFEKEIDIKYLKNNVFEMRGLSINLTSNSTEEKFDWDWNGKKGLSGYYYSPKLFIEEIKPINLINSTTNSTKELISTTIKPNSSTSNSESKESVEEAQPLGDKKDEEENDEEKNDSEEEVKVEETTTLKEEIKEEEEEGGSTNIIENNNKEVTTTKVVKEEENEGNTTEKNKIEKKKDEEQKEENIKDLEEIKTKEDVEKKYLKEEDKENKEKVKEKKEKKKENKEEE